MNHDDIPVGPRRGRGRGGPPDYERIGNLRQRDRPWLQQPFANQHVQFQEPEQQEDDQENNDQNIDDQNNDQDIENQDVDNQDVDNQDIDVDDNNLLINLNIEHHPIAAMDPHVGHLGDPDPGAGAGAGADPGADPGAGAGAGAGPGHVDPAAGGLLAPGIPVDPVAGVAAHPVPPAAAAPAPPPHIAHPAPQPVPAMDPALNQMFMQMLAGMLGHMAPPAPAPAVPDPDPNLAADLAYMDQVNAAFDDIDVQGPVIRPIIPPRALAGQHGPVAGADTTRDLQRRNIELADLVTRQAVLANNMVYRIGHPMPADTVQTLRAQAAETTQIALDLRQEARRQYVQLDNAARIHDRYNAIPIMPNYDGIVDPARVVSAKDLQAACRIFNPDDPKSPHFGLVWDALRYFGRDNNFQEINYRQALSVLLMGDAKELYHQHRDLNAPFEQTLTALYQAYAKPRSIQDDKRAILSIVRNPGESIAQCVARGEIQIDKQQLIHPVHK